MLAYVVAIRLARDGLDDRSQDHEAQVAVTLAGAGLEQEWLAGDQRQQVGGGPRRLGGFRITVAHKVAKA